VVYLALAGLLRSLPPSRTAWISAAFCVTVECLQLTPLPRTLSSRHLIARLVFGEYFGALDLPFYVLGVLAAWWFDRRWLWNSTRPPAAPQRSS
jgi:hypothetical protein